MLYDKTDMGVLYCGDSLDVLRTLPANSIDSCITSPPYWGLRDYGCDKQLGLEKTPEEYVANMVQLFREVRRVLKADGVLWLNLGDSYASNGCYLHTWMDKHPEKKHLHTKNSERYKDVPAFRGGEYSIKPKDLVGIPWRVALALQQPYEHHIITLERDRAYLAGLVDGEGCITILKTKSSHCDSFSYPPIVQVRMCDVQSIDYFAALMGVNRSEAELYNSQKSANQRPAYSVKATSQKAMDLIADIYPYLLVKRPQAIVAYNHQLYRNNTNYQARDSGQMEREKFCKELINTINQRKPYTIPSWMIEPKFVTEQGYYLRQDLIWHKPNPMPESVKDRCTKSHEYIFMLTKSARYYFDSDAIKENTESVCTRKRASAFRQQNESDSQTITTIGRNKRSVWTVTTKPYKEAHFATYPPDLILPCVKAARQDAVILDPFFGSGTTGLVAIQNGRRYIGIDLNPEYCEIAKRRIDKELQQITCI